MKTIRINLNDSGQRLDKFISKTLKLLPKSLIYKYIRIKRIKVNKKRAQISQLLNEGDIVDLYINDEFFETSRGKRDFLKVPSLVDIIYEDENIMLLNKNPGLVVHPDEDGSLDCLIHRIQKYLYNKGEYDPDQENSFAPSLVNRIDRNTSGIVIAAKNSEALRILNDKIKKREVSKRYVCIVHGIMKTKKDTLKGYLQKNELRNRVYISNDKLPGYKNIITKYAVIDEINNLSLLEVELITGRTHQIRAHLSFIGHPIVGDGKYGKNYQNKNTGLKYQALCSYKVKFEFKSPSGILNYLNNKEFNINDIWFIKDFYSVKSISSKN